MKLPDSMKDNIGMLKGRWIAALVLGLCIVVAVIVTVAVYSIQSYQCHYSETHYHKRTHYNLFAKCFIEVKPGQMVPEGQLQNFRPVP